MPSQARWSIKTAQGTPSPDDVADIATDTADATDPAQQDAQDNLSKLKFPPDFANNVGKLTLVNYLAYDFLPKKYHFDISQLVVQTRQMVLNQMGLLPLQKDSNFTTAIQALSGGKTFDNILPINLPTLVANLKTDETYDALEKPAIEKALQPYVLGATGPAIIPIQMMYENNPQFKAGIEKMKNQGNRGVQLQPAQRVQWTLQRTIKTAQDMGQGPMATGRYESMDQLKQDLIAMGPTPETYEQFMSLVGPDNEDDAKDALGSFFQGMSASLGTIYDMLVGVGLASPIDTSIVESLMSQHPELSENKENNDRPHVNKPPVDQAMAAKSCETKCAGLILPPLNSGINTNMQSDANRLEKTAGGSVGGAGTGYGAYNMSGPGENRMCPKIRQPVSTFICRYHCLDGINIDDHQTVCGEAIWRQSVMDKFSREYRDKDGNWVGGYLNKRFETHYDDGGHPALLKPGQRTAPIHEDAWSLEKRLIEVRKAEGKDRGYSETPGDGKKDLYNFDQHDLMKGPKAPQLTEKKKDEIAKLAANEMNIKVADSLLEKTEKIAVKEEPKKEKQPWTILPKHEPSKKDLKDVGVNPPKEKKEPWPPKDTPFDGPKKASFNRAAKNDKTVSEDKFKRCKEHVRDGQPDLDEGSEYAICTDSLHGQPASYHKKKKSANEWSLTKEAWGLDMSSVGGGGDLNNAMGENVNHGTVGKKCAACGKVLAAGMKVCSNPLCRSTNVVDFKQGDAERATGSLNNDGMIPIAAKDARIVVANGVFKAVKNGATGYGDSPEEAIFKLAAGLGDLKPMSVQDQSNAILDQRQDDMQETPTPVANPLTEPNPAPAPVVQQPMAAQTPIQAQNPGEPLPPPEVVIDETPTTETVPVQDASPVPTEIGPGAGGQRVSEFIPDKGMDTTQGPHISSDELNTHLASENMHRHPADTRDIEDQAIISGAHPD